MHEFGHMIGLADEYILSRDDHARLAAADPERARRQLRRRRSLTPRIMNAGNRVAPDHYLPFAAWLSELTQTEWRVGAPVPAAPSRR